MYSDIQTYFNAVITLVNTQISGTSNDLSEVLTSLDDTLLPQNERNNKYQIKLESVEELDYESRNIDEINVVIEFQFLMSKDRANYKNALDSLRLVKNYLKKSAMTEGTYFSINDIKDVKLSGLNNIVENNWLKPEATFTLTCMDTQ